MIICMKMWLYNDGQWQCVVCVNMLIELFNRVIGIQLILFLHIIKSYLNFYNGYAYTIKEKYSDIIIFWE